MSTVLQQVEKARADALGAKAEIEQRIEQVKHRINQVCRSGILPFDEAYSTWLAEFERYADDGAKQLEVNLTAYAQPNDEHPKTGNISSLRGRASDPFRADSRGDQGAVLAHINRTTIIEHARAWFEAKCANTNVPPAQERRAELERLAEEQRKLESQRDDLTDDLANLLGTPLSDRTRKARIEYENELHLEAINRPIREENERNRPASSDQQKLSRVTRDDQ